MKQIKRWGNDEVISEGETIKVALEKGVNDGKIFRRADLSRADLRGADLSGADLQRADLSRADLSRADLRGADLSGAYLSGADLSGADLRGADLRGADLSGAYLSGADLSGAYLRGADLSGAIYNGVKVNFLWSLGRLYKYNVVVVISEDNTLYIGLGCHFRKAIDWQNDFWNNVSEFPNDGGLSTLERRMALDFSVEFGIVHGGEVK